MTETDQTTEIQVISPAEARIILENAIRERLGNDWESEVDGWVMVDRADFHARLNRKRVNLDFYVDLLGQVRMEETEVSQDYDRILALVFLIGSVTAAIIIASIAGYL